MTENTMSVNDEIKALVVKYQWVIPFEFVDSFEALSQNRREAELTIDGMQHRVQTMTRFSVYVETRLAGYSHKQAVKKSNTAVAGVRKALGFSIPRQDMHI